MHNDQIGPNYSFLTPNEPDQIRLNLCNFDKVKRIRRLAIDY